MGKQQPALLGGVYIGVLSALPFINIGNCLCCMWVVTGGMLTVYLQQQSKPEPVETADAVVGGLLAGLVGAVVSAVLGFLMTSVTGPMADETIRQVLENPELPAEARDFLSRFASSRSMAFLGLVVTIPVFCVFSMLGGLLGLALFRKKTPPAAAPGV